MKDKIFVGCIALSLAAHLTVSAVFLSLQVTPRSQAAVLKVRFADLAARAGGGRQPGAAAGVKRALLGMQKNIPPVKPPPPKNSEAERSLSAATRPSAAPIRAETKPAEPPENPGKELSPTPIAARSIPALQRSSATSKTPGRNLRKIPGAAISSNTEEELSSRVFLAAQSATRGGLSVLSGTDAAASSPLDAMLIEATPISGENSPPIYPRTARRRGWEGEVRLRLRIAETGRVLAVRVDRSSGHGLLDHAALEAVRNWRFQAAHLGDRSVETEVMVPIRFELR